MEDSDDDWLENIEDFAIFLKEVVNDSYSFAQGDVETTEIINKQAKDYIK